MKAKKKTPPRTRKAERIGATPQIEALAQRVKQTRRDAAVKVVEADGIALKPLKAKAALFWAVDGQFIFAHTKQGKVYYSPRRYDDVRTAFDDGQVDLVWLTPNTVLSAQGPKGRLEVMFFPPAQYQLVCQYDAVFEGVPGVTFTPSKLAVLRVPMPGFLFAGYGNDYQILAVAGDTFDSKCRLYQVPLPNCYTHGGICWGNNEKPSVGKGGLLKAWQLFWETAFTAAATQSKSRAFPDDIRKRLISLVGHETYPNEDLVPAQVSPTQWVKELLGGRS